MWRNRLALIGLVIILVGGALLLTWFLLTPSVEQTKLPLFIATLSSLFSFTGVIASWLVVLEMQKDREELFKPDIYADFEVEEGLFVFVVRNVGQSSAKKVRVIIDPIPTGYNNRPIDDIKWLHEPIETLLPGKKLEKTVDTHIAIFNENRNRKFKISITYQSLIGKNYSEGPYLIDLDEYRNVKVPTRSSEKSFSLMADQLKKIADKQ